MSITAFSAASASIAIPLDAGDFCIMSRRVVDQLNAMPERRRFVRGLRAWVGFRQAGLPIDRAPQAFRAAEVHAPQARRRWRSTAWSASATAPPGGPVPWRPLGSAPRPALALGAALAAGSGLGSGRRAGPGSRWLVVFSGGDPVALRRDPRRICGPDLPGGQRPARSTSSGGGSASDRPEHAARRSRRPDVADGPPQTSS